MKRLALILATALTATSLSLMPAKAAPTPIDGSSVGVQLFMWNWKSIGKECQNELGPAGYDWVLVMPPQEHITGSQWWTHYQPVSYKIESRLGTRAEFAQMVSDCQTAGVKVIADAVINHMVGSNSGTGWAGTEFVKYNHPGLYDPSDFHPNKTGITDFNDVNQVQNYELLGLSDLATESPNVRGKIAGYLNDLLSLGVYGFRIDAARHIPVDDLEAIKALLPTNTYFLQEVAAEFNPDITDYLVTGDVWEFNWVRLMDDAFGYKGGASKLPKAIKLAELLPSAQVVTMVSNHDTERNGSAITTDTAAKQQLAFIYTLASNYGKPMIYSGYSFLNYDVAPKLKADGSVADVVCPAQDLPKAKYKNLQFTCQHRWKAVEAMIAWRDTVGNSKQTGLKASKGMLSFGRGAAGQVIINSNDQATKLKIKTSMAPGKYCDLISGGRNANLFPKQCLGTTVTVASGGYITLTVPKQTAIAISKDSMRHY